MAEVVLFHHAQGLIPGVVACADELRRAGHTVHTPDLFEGRTFGSIEVGMRYAAEIGFPDEVIERGARAVEGLPADLVYAGFSLGVLPAQKLAQTRRGARRALLFYSCVPVSAFGSAWPERVPVQVHGMDADPIFVGEGDIDAARELVDQAEDAEPSAVPRPSRIGWTVATVSKSTQSAHSGSRGFASRRWWTVQVPIKKSKS